jgi:hypothetical protein
VNKVDGQHASLGDNIYTTKGVARNLSLTAGSGRHIAGFAWKAFYSHQDSRVTVNDPQNTNNAKYMAAAGRGHRARGLKVNGVDVGGTVPVLGYHPGPFHPSIRDACRSTCSIPTAFPNLLTTILKAAATGA